MSPTPRLQCLFCKHLNPADGIFCDDCGGQLNLQPCDRCGAVDSRAASNCYKCGAEFSLPVAPGLDFPLTPATLDKELSYPTSIEAGVAGRVAAHPDHDLTYSPPETQPVDEVLSPGTAATATKSRRRTHVAILALILLLTAAAVSVYFYHGQPVQIARKQGQKQAVTDVSGAPKRGGSAPSTGAARTDAALKPVDTVPKSATGADAPGKAPSLVPPGADATLAARPLPATDAEVKTRQDLSIVGKCPPAVATLGLCNLDTQQEKH